MPDYSVIGVMNSTCYLLPINMFCLAVRENSSQIYISTLLIGRGSDALLINLFSPVVCSFIAETA